MEPPSSLTAEVVLVLGSGPNALVAGSWARDWFDRIVVINNAWRIRPDWDDLIFPEDFPEDRRPSALTDGQRLIEADQFVPAQNLFGGFVYAGGTMAYTAAYWALHALKPRVLAFMGCDMVYPATGQTHFYGTGTADPLRPDISLQDLGAKSARLALLAAENSCACVNLSTAASALLLPRAEPDMLRAIEGPAWRASTEVAKLLRAEAALDYMVPSGRYWEETDRFDAKQLARLDAGWRAAWPPEAYL